MKTKETSVKQRLYNKKYNSYAEWNGSAWEDKSIAGAYFHSMEKANDNGWFEEASTREQALAWWHQLSNEKQIDLQYLHNSPCRHPLNAIGLTSKEIEKIYDKEVLEPKRQEEWQESQVNRRYSKPNQKQFKQFSPELFKSYINKFSEEDKLKALFHIAQSLDMNVYQQQYKFELYPKLK
jgi:hypothetical protein